MKSMRGGGFRFSGKKSKRGFTIVEVLVAQTIVILSGVALMPYLIEEGEQKLLDTAANEMYVIADAAKAYHVRYGAWPNQANNCAVAAAITAMETDGFIGGVTATSIYGTNYAFSCNPTNRFVISMGVGAGAERTKYAQDLANLTYASTVDAATNTVAMNVPLPGAELALDQVLWRTFDASRPERNRMQTAIDMNSNDVNNVNSLSWGPAGAQSVLAANGQVNGRSLITACGDNVTGCGVSVSDEGGIYDYNDGWLTIAQNPLGFASLQSLRIGGGGSGLVSSPAANGSLDVLGPVTLGQTLITRGNITGGGMELALGTTDQTSRGNSGASRALVKDSAGGGASVLRLNYAGDYTGGVQIDGTRVNLPNASLDWANSSLTTDQGGSIELGARGAAAGAGASYIDFHYAGLAQDYNVRITNNANGQLQLDAPTTLATGDLIVNGAAEVRSTLDVRDDVVLQSTRKGLSQAIADAFIIDPAGSAASRTITKPSCPSGRTPVIFTAVSGVANGQNAYPIHQVDTYATDNGGSWTVNMAVLTTGTAYGTPDTGYGRIFAVTKCD